MSGKTIKIKEFSVNDLEKELNKPDFFKGQEHLPITKHRAVSQIHNPRADKSDVILLAAYSEGQICGYIGMLPDFIFYESKKEKIAWLTAWWVSPELKGKGFGYKLMNKALQMYSHKVFAVAASPHSQRVYMKSNEFDYLPIIPSTDFIIKYTKHHNKIKNVIINIFNSYNSLKIKRQIRKYKSIQEKFHITEFKSFDSEIEAFIDSRNKNSLFKWNIPEFQWFQKYPWVLSNNESDNRYYFSSSVNRFEYKNFVVKKENKIIGFFISRIRDNFMTLPYVYYEQEAIEPMIFKILNLIKNENIYALTVTDKSITNILKKLPTLKQIILPNKSVVSKKFEHIDFSVLKFQDGYGDIAFT